jgi:hypothetical protein
MPPKGKGKRTKAEEAADFLSTLDDFDVVPSSSPPPSAGPDLGASTTLPAPAGPTASVSAAAAADPRSSIDSKRSFKADAAPARSTAGSPAPGPNEQDEEAANALAFLEEQIKTKRAPLSVPGPGSLRGGALSGSSPLSGPKASSTPEQASPALNEPSQDTQSAAGGGWGSWWSTATTAVQAAQKIADEGIKKVRAEGVQGLDGVVLGGVDLGSVRKGAEERLKGIQSNIQIQGLDKLSEHFGYV